MTKDNIGEMDLDLLTYRIPFMATVLSIPILVGLVFIKMVGL
jgi:hypothetical protein